MVKTSVPKDPIDQFLDKLPSQIAQEIIGNDGEVINRRRTLVSKGNEALRLLKAKNAMLMRRNEKPLTRAGLVVDFLCRQGYSYRQMSIPMTTLSDILGIKRKKDIEQMQTLVSSHLESSFQNSSRRRGQKRKQSTSSARSSSTSLPRGTKVSEPSLIKDLCIHLGPMISNTDLAASYAHKIFTTLTNISNNLLTDDISRNTKYYEAACLFLAVQRIEGSGDTKPKRATKKAMNKNNTEAGTENDEDVDMEEDQTLTKRDVMNAANLREATFNGTLKLVNDYIQNIDIPIPMSVTSSIIKDESSSAAEKVPKPPKKRVVSEKLEKWKRDTLKNARDNASKSSVATDAQELIRIAADEVLQKYGINA